MWRNLPHGGANVEKYATLKCLVIIKLSLFGLYLFCFYFSQVRKKKIQAAASFRHGQCLVQTTYPICGVSEGEILTEVLGISQAKR